MATSKTYHGVSDASVTKATGHSWQHWFIFLDKAGAKTMTHKAMASWLQDEGHISSAWWCQMVTVQYEKERGLRLDHQMAGGFEISVSKTIAVPVGVAYEAFTLVNKRKRWLDETLEFTTKNENKSLRAAFAGGSTRISINFYEKGAGKCQVVAQHLKLKDAKAAEARKKFWKEKLQVLSDMLA